jgi:DNA-binding winged helix-turn-helix (wHTH) protein
MAFGDVTVDVESRRVRAPSGASRLEPRVLDLLLTLVERPGLTASRDHLIETVWDGGVGSGLALDQAVIDLRRALGDDARAPRFIETVPRIGYRWIFEPPPAARRPWSLSTVWSALGFEPRSFVER